MRFSGHHVRPARGGAKAGDMPRLLVLAAGTVLGVLVSVWPALAQMPQPPPVRPAPYCPSDVTLTVSTAPQVTVGSRTTATVVISGAVNLKAASDVDPASLRLFYFVDNLAVPPGFFIMPGDPVSTVDLLPDIPNRTPKIIESSSTAQDLGILPAGRHQIAVVLGQADRVSCGLTASTSMFVVPPLPATVPAA